MCDLLFYLSFVYFSFDTRTKATENDYFVQAWKTFSFVEIKVKGNCSPSLYVSNEYTCELLYVHKFYSVYFTISPLAIFFVIYLFFTLVFVADICMSEQLYIENFNTHLY